MWHSFTLTEAWTCLARDLSVQFNECLLSELAEWRYGSEVPPAYLRHDKRTRFHNKSLCPLSFPLMEEWKNAPVSVGVAQLCNSSTVCSGSTKSPDCLQIWSLSLRTIVPVNVGGSLLKHCSVRTPISLWELEKGFAHLMLELSLEFLFSPKAGNTHLLQNPQKKSK
jgi:hypothetical protein